jgi:hypothetical protein
MWTYLDEQTRIIMEWQDVPGASDMELNKCRGRAQGVAHCLYLLIGAHYDDERAVAIQAAKRYRMSTGAIDWEATPGVAGYTIGEVKLGRVPDNTSPDVTGIRTVDKNKLPPKPVHVSSQALTDEQVTGIKSSLSANFEPDMIAKAFGITVAQVNKVKAG